MRTAHLRRPLAAIVTAAACLVAMASPAAAATHDADITGGTITFTKSGFIDVLDLAPATPDCPTVPPTLQLDVTGTAVGVTAFDARDTWTTSSTTLLRMLTRSSIGNTPGTLTGTTVSPMTVGFVMTFYLAYDPTTCTPTGTPYCTLIFPLTLDGTLTGTTASDTFSFSRTPNTPYNLTSLPSCGPGASAFNGTVAPVTSPITGHLTT